MGQRRGVTIKLRDGSGTITLKYLSEETDRNGNVRIYYRRNGKRFRLRATPGTTEFLDEYRSVRDGNIPANSTGRVLATKGTFRWLVEQYYQSAEFKAELSERTQYVRRGILENICKLCGSKPYALMEPRHVRQLRDKKANVPGTANGWVKALRQLFNWAKEAFGLRANPAKEVPYISTDGEGFHSWTVEEVRQFEKRHSLGTKARLALDLLLYTGVRRSDVILLGKQMEVRAGTALKFTVTKGRRRFKKELELPILPRLRKSIDATPSQHLTYLLTPSGKPYGHGGFGNWFRKRCDEAGLPKCAAHGLRKAGATLAAENGASAHQLMAIFGWSSLKDAELYTRRANQSKLARSAMHLIEMDENEIVSLSAEVDGSATIAGKKSK
jgi:site-specific recombinase XerD